MEFHRLKQREQAELALYSQERRKTADKSQKLFAASANCAGRTNPPVPSLLHRRRRRRRRRRRSTSAAHYNMQLVQLGGTRGIKGSGFPRLLTYSPNQRAEKEGDVSCTNGKSNQLKVKGKIETPSSDSQEEGIMSLPYVVAICSDGCWPWTLATSERRRVENWKLHRNDFIFKCENVRSYRQ
jgi:hypothetical protein